MVANSIVPGSSNVLTLGRERETKKGHGRRKRSVFPGRCTRAMGWGWSTAAFYGVIIPRDSVPSMYTVPIYSTNPELINM